MFSVYMKNKKTIPKSELRILIQSELLLGNSRHQQ